MQVWKVVGDDGFGKCTLLPSLSASFVSREFTSLS